MDSLGKVFITETIAVFKQQKEMVEKALIQVKNDSDFFKDLGPRSHSIAKNVKHLSGNIKSRWKNFLTIDGEKPDRNRDNEFLILENDSRNKLMNDWNDAWEILLHELSILKPEDLNKIVTIRQEEHTVIKAIQRSLAHTAYHTGQILYQCRLIKQGDWNWITIAPNASKEFNQEMKNKNQ